MDVIPYKEARNAGQDLIKNKKEKFSKKIYQKI